MQSIFYVKSFSIMVWDKSHPYFSPGNETFSTSAEPRLKDFLGRLKSECFHFQSKGFFLKKSIAELKAMYRRGENDLLCH